MGNSVGRQPERGPEDPFNRNNHEIFDDILPSKNNFAGPFDYEGEGVLNDHFMGADLIPRRAPVSPRFQGYRAQDLFLPQPRREESDDESHRSNGDINGDEDGDDDGDDDDNDDNDDDDDNDDIYVQPERSDHGGNPIIESKYCLWVLDLLNSDIWNNFCSWRGITIRGRSNRFGCPPCS